MRMTPWQNGRQLMDLNGNVVNAATQIKIVILNVRYVTNVNQCGHVLKHVQAIGRELRHHLRTIGAVRRQKKMSIWMIEEIRKVPH